VLRPEDLWSVFKATEATLRNQGVVDEDVVIIEGCIPLVDSLHPPPYHARYKWPEFGNPNEWTTQFTAGDGDRATRVQVEKVAPKNAIMCKAVPRKPHKSKEERVEPPPETQSAEQTSGKSDEDDEGPPDQSAEQSAERPVSRRERRSASVKGTETSLKASGDRLQEGRRSYSDSRTESSGGPLRGVERGVE
jgi:hypothetical protein